MQKDPPHLIQVRLDGWLGHDPTRAPACVAEAIARAMPQGDGNSVADIKSRMIARPLRHERGQLNNE